MNKEDRNSNFLSELGRNIMDKVEQYENPIKVANRNARGYVQRREAFRGNNVFGYWWFDTPRYVVSSYSHDFPLFIWEAGVWYENVDKYSITTSKHKTQTHPLEDTLPMTWDNMVVLMHHGIAGVAAGATT